MLIFIPVFGLLSDKVRRRKPFVLGGTAFMGLLLIALGFASGDSIIALFGIMGLAMSSITPAVRALSAEILGPEMASEGFAVLGICSSLGAAATSPFIGWILDSTGSYFVSLFSLGGIALSAAAAAFFLDSK
jgi:MFS family permease